MTMNTDGVINHEEIITRGTCVAKIGLTRNGASWLVQDTLTSPVRRVTATPETRLDWTETETVAKCVVGYGFFGLSTQVVGVVTRRSFVLPKEISLLFALSVRATLVACLDEVKEEEDGPLKAPSFGHHLPVPVIEDRNLWQTLKQEEEKKNCLQSRSGAIWRRWV